MVIFSFFKKIKSGHVALVSEPAISGLMQNEGQGIDSEEAFQSPS